ncbi:hypothetical protein L0337_44610 [candidate division KSB1 bacterium]|nr:hypothetical protein [candidate division KSB1 bacterium]
MAKRKRRAKQGSLVLICAWCNTKIPPDTEVFSIATKKLPGIDLSNHEGKFIPLHLALAKKRVEGFVAPKGSPAKKDGYDVVFVACSENCGRALKTALQKEKEAAGLMSMN